MELLCCVIGSELNRGKLFGGRKYWIDNESKCKDEDGTEYVEAYLDEEKTEYVGNFPSSYFRPIVKKDWYRCKTREEMVELVVAGFDYVNFRKAAFNNGNLVYHFERTKELNDYLKQISKIK